MLMYIHNHWVGKHGFTQAVCVNIVLLNSCIAFVLNRLVAWFQTNQQGPHFLFMIVMLLLCLSLLVWQATGAFRSASTCIKQSGSSAHYYGVLAVMLISTASILGGLATLSGGSRDYRQEAIDAYTPPEKTYQLSVTDMGGLTFTGDIGRGATAALSDAVQGVSKGTRFSLQSMGGLIVEARGMAKVVKAAGLHTHVTGRCFSACTLVFIAGFQRSVELEGELGFHQYRVDAQSSLPWIEPELEQEKDQQLFKEKGVAHWFLEKAYLTAHSSIWIPSRNELITAGVITLNSH